MTSNVHSVLTTQRGPGRATTKVTGLEKDVKVKRDQTRMAEKVTQILTATVITVLLFTVLFLDGRRFFSNEPSVDGRELNFLTRLSFCLRSLLRCQQRAAQCRSHPDAHASVCTLEERQPDACAGLGRERGPC